MPLTDIQIKNAKPGLKPARKAKHQEIAQEQNADRTGAAPKNPKYEQTSKPYKLADAKGLYIEIHPAGGKYWRFKYRFDGREKRLSLGVYPETHFHDGVRSIR